MRTMEPRDVPRLLELYAEQNRRDGTLYALPRLFQFDGRPDENIAMALSVERDGDLAQGLYFQKRQIVEMCFAGPDAKATAYSRREIGPVSYALKSLGYDSILCLVPHVMAQPLKKPLEATGFNSKFAPFYLDI
jgi:hypothetical protein